MKILISLSASIDEGHVFLNPVHFVKSNGLTLKDSKGQKEVDPDLPQMPFMTVYKGHERAGSLYFHAGNKTYEFVPVERDTPESSSDPVDRVFRGLNRKSMRSQSADDFIPPAGAAKAAAQSLAWRKQYGRAMTPVGIARARQLKNRQRLSLNTIKRMVSYFARHEVDKQAKSWVEGHRDGGPSNGKIAWYGWGGDAGRAWALKIYSKYKS